MSASLAAAREASPRVATRRRYLMCPPTYFSLAAPINPWMTHGSAIDVELATAQWTTLRDVYRDLGHEVAVLEPRPGLPDMVFAANGGVVVGDRAFVARFAHAHRREEADHHRDRFRRLGLEVRESAHVNEGEGDFLKVGGRVLAGCGFRTSRQAHDDLAELFGLPVVSLTLIDPRFYHLDVALAVLADDAIAYHPQAFSAESRALLGDLFPDAVLVDADEATRFACNAVSDGEHVVIDAAATGFDEQLRAVGFEPIPVDMSELRKSGGSVKCCTLELY